MKLSEEKISLLKKALTELYEFILNTTSLLEGDLKYLRSISKSEIKKLDEKDPSSKEIEFKLDVIKDRANAVNEKLKESIENHKASLGLEQKDSLSDFLLSKEVNESLDFNEKFLASAVATAISKIKC
ncbi:MAG: hypothetical protein A3I68_03160 [Candidatus Melainabacteria bacterium RIFCSPLOWO2_02_FULL_35_15]|nr:MAG: hypothetical protein A3F80_05225 [Candidatus Melainabacteria bacterium RIFCSPLOWO2_12_FULL_35_11]OGI13084.1 MAG: hypothetical protein A3I68_03160 [Candidatus Melainabacteria bacterium RIFCSPLOWO2_02_FULL_35_15]